MKALLFLLVKRTIIALAVCGFAIGCQAIKNFQTPTDAPTKPKPLRGPHGSYGYEVEVITSDPGSKIEVNKAYVGDSPLTIVIYGDGNGAFRDDMEYVIKAYPVRPGQNLQWKYFTGGRDHTPRDRIPKRIYFDLSLERAPEKKELKVDITTEDKTK